MSILDKPYFRVGNRVVDNPVELIGDQILTGAAASVSFVVPVGYGILLLEWHDVGNDDADNVRTMQMTFNSDTGSNYDYSFVAFGSASLTVNAQADIDFGFVGKTSSDNRFSSGSFVIFNRAAQEKVVIGTSTFKYGGGGAVEDTIGYHVEAKWRNTSDEISGITIFPNLANFTADSRFILLGVKI